MIIVAFVLTMIAIITVMLLDSWSTHTLMAYKHLNIYNENAREKLREQDTKKGINRHELNVFARYFFNKFGYKKGSTIFSIVVRYPLIAFAFFIAYTSKSYIVIFGLLMFYLGVMFSQILRASAANNFAKQIGVNLKEYNKKIETKKG